MVDGTLPNRLIHFDTFEVYFFGSVSLKTFFILVVSGLVLSIIYIPFDYQLH